MHPLLESQLVRYFGGTGRVPPECLPFIAAIHDAYRQADDERAELESLRGGEGRFRQLFQDNPLPLYVFDLETFRFLEVNDATVAHFGYSREELLTMTLDDIRPAEDVGRLHTHIGSLKADVSCGGLWRHRRKDGTIVEVEITSHEVKVAGRRVRLVLANDVTERRKSEAALRESQEQLRQAQKMEAVGQLAGGVAHDFNNLLTVIKGTSELLLDDLDPDGQHFQDVREIQRAATRAAGLTRQLLAFSRKQLLKPVDLDLNGVVGELEPMLRRLIGENIEMATILAPELWEVTADPGQIELVLMNLVVNARDAMPDGGTLTIETGNARAEAVAAGLPPGSYIAIDVSDTGTGIPESTLARVFEPFFTTKAPGKGTGLGLSTVYGIVKQSGGEVVVKSEVGKGTSFRVYLPRTLRAKHTGEYPVVQLRPERGDETILLVEDEESVRSLAKRILERQGYCVLPARHGADALRLAGTHQGRIDLLLTDIVMPEMGGQALSRRLIPLRPGVKVLYMSGYSEEHLFPPADDSGFPAPELLQKPFTSASLTHAVRGALGAVGEGVGCRV